MLTQLAITYFDQPFTYLMISYFAYYIQIRLLNIDEMIIMERRWDYIIPGQAQLRHMALLQTARVPYARSH